MSLLICSAPRLGYGRASGRVIDLHDWRYIPSNHLTEKGIIALRYDDFRSPYRPKRNQKLRGTGLYGVENRMFYRFLLWNHLKSYTPQRTVPPLEELREDWKTTVGSIWLIWSVLLLYVPQKLIHLTTENTPWLPGKTDGSRRPKQRSPMIWYFL